mgnify:CR=1 FL=1
MRVSPIPVARAVGTAYVTVFRNTPLTLIVLLCSIGLYQNLGLTLAAEAGLKSSSAAREPRIGTPNTNTAKAAAPSVDSMPSTKYGSSLPIRITSWAWMV